MTHSTLQCRQEFDSISQLPCLKSRSDNQKILKGCVSVQNHDAKVGREAAQFRRGVGKGGDYNGNFQDEFSSDAFIDEDLISTIFQDVVIWLLNTVLIRNVRN